MVAIATATIPSHFASVRCSLPEIRIAPMMLMPEIAFDPDMRGVCRVGGTLVMTSKPTNIANTKIVMVRTNGASITPPGSASPAR
jgi:hypothetical protein